MVYSDERNTLQQAETSPGQGRGKSTTAQATGLQIAGELERKETYL